MAGMLLSFLSGCGKEPLDPALGRAIDIVWRVPGSGAGRVTQDSRLVFFPGENEVVAVTKATGKVAWRSTTRAGGGGTVGFGTTVSGEVVVMVDVYLYAFDRSNGHPRWMFPGEPGAPPANADPTSNDSVVFSGSGGGVAWALRAGTGEVIWRRPSPVAYPAIALDPVVAGDQLFVGYSEMGAGTRGALVSLDAITGEVSWLHEFAQYVDTYQDANCQGNVVVDETRVYVWFGRGDVAALDRRTGAMLWRNPATHGLLGTVRRPLALARGILVVGSTDGHLEGLVPETGEMLWSRQLSFGSLNDRFAHDDRAVYVTISGGAVAAINPLDGSVVWSNGLGWRGEALYLWGPGVTDDENLYLGGGVGYFAFRK